MRMKRTNMIEASADTGECSEVRDVLLGPAKAARCRRPSKSKPKLRVKAFSTSEEVPGFANGAAGRHSSGDDVAVLRDDDAGHETAWRHRLFPSWAVWVIYAMTLTMRLRITGSRDNWWILHPDEVYQSVEVAHSEVYGYGFRPYEYLPPPSSTGSSTADRQEAALGMHSLRSFLYPKCFMLVLHLKEYLGVKASPFIVAKVTHAIVAAHLPLAVYYFVSSYTCSDVAVTSALLVAFTDLLVVLGTHPLVNSFLSPFIFACLGAIIRYTDSSSLSHKRDLNSDKEQCRRDAGGRSVANGHSCWNGVSGFASSSRLPLECNGSRPTSLASQKASEPGGRCHNPNEARNTDTRKCAPEARHKLPSHQIFVKEACISILSSGVLTVLIYIRLDTILVITAIVVPHFILRCIKRELNLVKLVLILTGCSVGALFAGADDHTSYGSWFISPIQWYRFNVHNDFSSAIFGNAAVFAYATDVFASNPLMSILLAIIATSLVLVLTWLPFRNASQGLTWPFLHLTCASALLLATYSFRRHKEIRFIHNVLVLFLVTASLAIVMVYRTVVTQLPGAKTNHQAGRIVTWACLGAYIVFNMCTIPDAADKSNAWLTYLNHWDSNHINDCLDFVGRQPDSTGVFMDRSFHISGGYSVLHKDIPIFTLVHYEFQEFSKSSRIQLESNDWTGKNKTIEVSVLGRVNNFISIENTPLLLKYLINQHEYNYWIVKSNRIVFDSGLEEVFTSGTMRVLKRVESESVTNQLRYIADAIFTGTNSTVLEYEGSWLYTLGLYQKAIERLTVARQLDPTRIRIHQLLAQCYRALGQQKEALAAIKLCQRLHGLGQCNQPQPRVSLHEEYRINVPEL